MVAERAPRLRGESGLSGMGAVVGATEPAYLARLRELMPDFGLPDARRRGPGRQPGGARDRPSRATPASVVVAASRSIAGASDPAAAAAELRDRVWAVSQTAAR